MAFAPRYVPHNARSSLLLTRDSGSADPNLFSCFTDQSARDRLNYGAGIPGNLSDTALGQIWAYSLALDEACLATQKDFGSLIGSTFVAKDMLSLTETLNDDGLFRYYGR